GGTWTDTTRSGVGNGYPGGRGSSSSPLTNADIQNEVSAALAVVSSGLRHLATIVFGVIADDNEMTHRETRQLIRKRPNLVGLGSKLAEEPLQEICRTHQPMQADIELVESEAQLDILCQQPHDIGLKLAPRRPKGSQALKSFRPRWRVKDGVG